MCVAARQFFKPSPTLPPNVNLSSTKCSLGSQTRLSIESRLMALRYLVQAADSCRCNHTPRLHCLSMFIYLRMVLSL